MRCRPPADEAEMDTFEDSQRSQDSVMTVTQENRHEILYFAYGSNLSTEQMRQRCPHSTPVGLGYLDGWRWIINERGYANVVQQPAAEPAFSGPEGSDRVYGLLYLLPPWDEGSLDACEGVPWAYEKMRCDYIQWAGRDEYGIGSGRATALVYVDRKRVTEGPPREEYVQRMERGIEDAVENWGLDRAYADRVMRRHWRA
ncbi:hypothetical protein RJ55_01107 [Drechmeria coniospora]|nr:hypothetical protein RJ55_01107 [Drechmeria coniospora]